MGPLAESMGVSTSMAMWLAVAQLPIMMGLALHYPTVRVDTFATSVRTVLDPSDNVTVAVASSNESAVQVVAYEHGFGISGLYVLNAAAVTFFAVLTMNLLDRGVVASVALEELRSRGASAIAEEEFVSQNVGMVVDPTFRMWNQVRMMGCGLVGIHYCMVFMTPRACAQAFTALLLVTHTTFAATVCSPVSWDVLSTYVLLVYVSLVALVQPQNNFGSERFLPEGGSDGMAAAAGMMASVSSQSNMFRTVAYMIAFGYVLLHVPLDPLACKAQFMLVLACLDALLLYGHLWDRVPSLQVVLNCRFLYACLLAFLNAGGFVAWRGFLATPFVAGREGI